MHRSNPTPRSPSIRVAPGLIALALFATPTISHALPSFARQMNTECITCHTAFPVLNQFGRQFKLSGYTTAGEGAGDFLPVAVMLQPSFTHTAKGQEGGAAPGFGDNNNFALSQASVFYAGRVFGPFADRLFGKDAAAFLDKFGVFSQTTYDGVAKAWSWDNTELRFADTGTVGGQDLTYGFYANNNPTMQDPWHGTPAWGFPFSSSKLAPGPAAATLIEGGLAQQVAGVGAYALIANTVYLDIGGYRTLGARLQKQLGVDPAGEAQIGGIAPYWRVAIERMVGDGRWEFGTFGLAADTYPGRDNSEGKDRIVDFGFDTQYQLSAGLHDVTAVVSYIYERQNWNASYALGNAENTADTLHSAKAMVTYLYDKTYGGAAEYFIVDGGSDATLYGGSAAGSPTSDGLVFEADYLPFNKGGGPSFWPRSNMKLSLQYTVYNRFNGARSNFDGNGANARDNNTLYLEAWIAF